MEDPVQVHQGEKPSPAELSAQDKLDIHYWMLLTRAVDERCHTLYKQGRLPGSIFSQLGHEAIAVGSAYVLEPDDVIAPMHRDLGGYLVRGMTPGRVFAQAMGRTGAPSKGRDTNTHGLGDLNLNIIGYVSHLPQSLPVALGAAMAFQYRGEKRVALSYFGDGSTSEGGCHETLNLASVFKAPVVFVLENNQYAYSTPTKHQFAIQNPGERAAGYGMPGRIIDGNDVIQVWKTTREAVERARAGEGPTLIECKTMRMRGHAVHDPADYVPKELLEEWAKKDPLARFAAHLRGAGLLDDDKERRVRERVAREVDEAVAWAEASPWPDPGTLTEGVFA